VLDPLFPSHRNPTLLIKAATKNFNSARFMHTCREKKMDRDRDRGEERSGEEKGKICTRFTATN